MYKQLLDARLKTRFKFYLDIYERAKGALVTVVKMPLMQIEWKVKVYCQRRTCRDYSVTGVHSK